VGVFSGAPALHSLGGCRGGGVMGEPWLRDGESIQYLVDKSGYGDVDVAGFVIPLH